MKRAGWGWHSDGEDKVLPNAGSFIHALDAAAGRRRHDVRGHLCRVRGAAGRRASQDHGTARVLFAAQRFHEVYYPHLPSADRRAEEGAARRLASDRAPPSDNPAGPRSTSAAGRTRSTAWTDAEAQELIDYLKDFATRPEFVYRHQWRVGDALLWDNRCAQHCATPFDDAKYKRLMQRTTLEGETPLMAEREVFRPDLALV